LIPVEFWYGNEDKFFLQKWVWDSETRPAPLPSLRSTSNIAFSALSLSTQPKAPTSEI